MYQEINPYTGLAGLTFAESTDADIEAALGAGNQFFQNALTQDVGARATVLARIADQFDAQAAALAELATMNMGKLPAEALAEAHAAANIARFYAENGARLLAPRPYAVAGTPARLIFQPTGVVLAVEPWNFPYTQVMRVFAPNFIVGNAVILKHASGVPGCAAAFADCVAAARTPTGAFKTLFPTRAQVATMIADLRVQGVALTGSPAAGAQIAGQAGAALTKTTMELGGNDALIVLADADVDAAVKAGAASRLRNAGQVCTAAKRYIVHADVAAEFTAKMVTEFAKYVPGDLADATTTIAPLASARGRVELQAQVDAAIAGGAEVLVAGGTVADSYAQFAPVLLTNMTPDNPMYDAEFFGPVGQIRVGADDDELVRLANDTQYGLAGAVFGATAHAQQVAERVVTGQIFINQPAGGYPALPFGGVKNSGYGREMSDLALFEFANAKIIY